MINRNLFTPDGSNPPFPVPLDDLCTVPTEHMAHLLADLLLGGATGQDVLEIGTGSGYQTAILAERCRSVVSVDIKSQPGVAERLPNNVALIVTNGIAFDSGEKFDGVLVTFGAAGMSQAWINQVKDGGRLVVPIETGSGCRISVYQKVGTGLVLIDVAAYAGFTPGAEA